MVNASHCVGFTFPGIIEEPGSLDGKINSPIPVDSIKDFSLIRAKAGKPWVN